MSCSAGPEVVTTGLVLELDAGNAKSYLGSGTTWTDLSGNGNNGTLTNSPTYATTNGGTISFNGTTSTIQIPSFNVDGTALSIFGWFKFNSLQATEVSIIRKDTIFQLGLANPSTSTVRCLVATTGTTGWTAANDFFYPFTNSTWYYLGFVYDNGVTNFYVNGVNIRTITSITGAIPTGTNPVAIAGNYTGAASTTYLNGDVPSVSVYNTALTGEQVMQNFNALRGRYGIGSDGPQFVSSTSSSSNVIASMPTYQAGDLILLAGLATGLSTESTTPSGYTRINGVTTAGGAGAAGTMWYKIASASETPPTISAGFVTAMMVYRGVLGVGNSAVTAYGSTSLTFTYPTITLNTTNGSSFVAAFAVNPTYNFSTPANTLLVAQFEDVASPTTGSHAIAIMPSAERVTSWSGVSSTISQARIGVTMSVEIRV